MCRPGSVPPRRCSTPAALCRSDFRRYAQDCEPALLRSRRRRVTVPEPRISSSEVVSAVISIRLLNRHATNRRGCGSRRLFFRVSPPAFNLHQDRIEMARGVSRSAANGLFRLQRLARPEGLNAASSFPRRRIAFGRPQRRARQESLAGRTCARHGRYLTPQQTTWSYLARLCTMVRPIHH